MADLNSESVRPPAPDIAEVIPTGHTHVSEDSVRRLIEAVTSLAVDPEYFLNALTDHLLAMQPVSPDTLTKAEQDFLIKSGTFTTESWAAATDRHARGSAHVLMVRGWLLSLLETLPIWEAAVFLGREEDTVRKDAAAGRLYAIEVSGQLRFPRWQFDLGSPGKLLPGLSVLIAAAAPRWDWQSVAGFMSTPQFDLIAEGRQTPVEWLRGGGDIDSVTEIVESTDGL